MELDNKVWSVGEGNKTHSIECLHIGISAKQHIIVKKHKLIPMPPPYLSAKHHEMWIPKHTSK